MTDFMTLTGEKVLGVSIRSIKRDRTYILNLFASHPQIAYMVHNSRRYTASDVAEGKGE